LPWRQSKLNKDGSVSTFSTYTLPIAQRTIEKFAKNLLGESEVEAILQRLDRLTQDEARMTVAQTLGIVHGLVGDVKVVMEGTQCMHVLLSLIVF
jgi:hypothetical protein